MAQSAARVITLLCGLVYGTDIAWPAEPAPDGQVRASMAAAEAEAARDLALVDDYLAKWDRFAQGENALVPFLRDNGGTFEGALTRLLRAGDRRAQGRLVFYVVVQVGGGIPVESDLGKASGAVLGPDFPVNRTREGQRVYFAGDLYFWWQEHRHKYEPFPLFDAWASREFTRTSVVPLYQSLRKNR